MLGRNFTKHTELLMKAKESEYMWNCLCKPTALVEVEEIACNGTDERLTVTGKVICSATTPRIDKVIFNGPATIVFWSDGTKTVVKAKNEEFDKEKGLAMAISKKFFGNKGNYFNNFKKFCTRGEAE